jgi:hypothetical protein
MKKILPLFYITGIVLLHSCINSTEITSSWRNPKRNINIVKANKVLVLAMFKNKISGRLAEDQMASYLGGKGIVSYKYLDSNFNKKNVDAIRNKIRDDNFDGVITMRLIDAEKEKVYNPSNFDLYPPYYLTFSGYYYRNFSYNSNEDYYTTSKVFTVETNVFSIKEDKIIWTGITKTTDPSGVERMMKEIAHVVFKKMLKEGVISKK